MHGERDLRTTFPARGRRGRGTGGWGAEYKSIKRDPWKAVSLVFAYILPEKLRKIKPNLHLFTKYEHWHVF
jgi:hypothetical protein